MSPRTSIPALFLASAALLLGAIPAAAGSKYGTPKSGAWKVEDSFGSTKGGAMSLSKKQKLTKLVVKPGDDQRQEACGNRIELVGKPTLKSYRNFGGRYALARVRKGLLVPTPATLKVDGKRRRGTVKILWNSPTLATPAEFTFGDCDIDFRLRK